MPYRDRPNFPVKLIVLSVCAALAGPALGGCSSREQRADNYAKSGADYLSQKNYSKARVEFLNAIQLKNDNVKAWRGLATIDEHDHNLQSLVRDLSRVTEIDNKDVDARVRLARLYLVGGAPNKALKLVDAATQLQPKNASILALKAAVLYRLKDTQRAAKEADDALALDPHNADALVVIATRQFIEGDPAAALTTLKNLDAKSGAETGVLLLKINIYDKLGKPDEVESLLHKLIALNPKNAIFRAQLIRFYLAHGRKDDAEKALRANAATEPNNSAAELELVSFLNAVKGYEPARAELLSRIKAGGDVFAYKIALAKLDFAHGKSSGAIDELDGLLKSSTAAAQITTVRLTLADMYMSQKKTADVESLVKQVLDGDKDNTEALRLRALVHLERNQTDDAIADLRHALNEQPRSPELLVALSVAYERSGSIELADKALLDATKASNYASNIGLTYVAFLQRRSFTTQAEMILGELVKRHPYDPQVLAALAQDRLAHHDWAEAHEIAKTLRRSKTQKAVADQIDAAAYLGEKKLADSISVLKDAHQAAPSALQPLISLVEGYLRAGQYNKAEDALNQALKESPSDANLMVLLGSVKLAQKDVNAAQNEFERAVQAQPKNPSGYRALADLYLRRSEPDQAVAILRKGLQVVPNSLPMGLALASALEIKKDYNGAIAEYEALLKKAPGSMIVANNLASLLADHRTDQASIDRAQSLAAMLKDSQVPQFQDTLGWVNYLKGDYASARSSLDAAAEKMPNYPLVRYHLGMTYLASGDRAKALEQFAKAQALSPNDAELKAKIDAALNSPPKHSRKNDPSPDTKG